MQGMNINQAAPNTTAPSMPPPPPVSGVPPDKGHFTTRDWYYGPITRAQCDDVLNQRGHDGDFLIRDSETNVSADTDGCSTLRGMFGFLDVGLFSSLFNLLQRDLLYG